LNAMQIFKAESIWIARNMNLVAASYMIGSTMFLAGSIPYLIPLETEGDILKLDRFLAWTFIVGSIFFFIGGLINYARAYKILKEDFAQLKESEIPTSHEEYNGSKICE